MTSSCAPGRPGPIVLTATVRSSDGTVPTGPISFSNGSTVIGSPVLDPSGQATFTPQLTPGRARITAAFAGVGELKPSTSRVLNLRVGPGSTCVVRERSHHGTNNSNNNNNADASGGGGIGHKRHHRF
ncbi:Ig-like domain-containing protein [Streptosporangium subroseum]|uniref:Ig-like domain-containing protein n=1 Tax=Streptosporangium subroseum TaxID=106412 RepID=UPI0034380CFD